MGQQSMISKMLNYRSAIIAFTFFLVFIGISNIVTLPVSMFPNSTKPTVKINIAHDLDTLAFKDEIGKDLESSLMSLSGIERVEAVYKSNAVSYFAVFDWGKDPDLAINDTSAVASFYQTRLPDHLPPIKVYYHDVGIENYVAVQSKSMNAKELGLLLNKKLTPALREITGMQYFYISNVNADEVIVTVDPYRLIEFNVKPADVAAALHKSRFNESLGTLPANADDAEQHVFFIKKVSDFESLVNISIARIGDRIVKLGDVAEVSTQISAQGDISYLGDEPAIAIAAWPKPNTNLYQFAKDFQQTVRNHTAGIADVYYLNDPLAYIDDSLKNVLYAVLLSMLFAAMAVAVSFVSLKLMLIITLIMPLSLLCSGLVLSMLGVGLNLVSLGAMSVSIGLVIDNAIVVMDQICLNIKAQQPKNSASLIVAVKRSVAESANAVIASTVTTIVVFAPLAFTLPIVYSLVGELALVVVSVLVSSLFISLLFIPAVIISLSVFTGNWRWLERGVASKPSLWIRGYTWLVYGLLQYKSLQLMLVSIISLLFIYSLHIAATQLPTEIVAEPKPNIIDVEIRFASINLTNEQKDHIVKPVRQFLTDEFSSKINYQFTSMRQTVAYVSLYLNNFQDAEFIVKKIRQNLKDTADYSIDVSPWVSAKLLVPEVPDVRIVSIANSPEKQRQDHQVLEQALKADPLVYQVNSFPKSRTHDVVNVALNDSLSNALRYSIENEALGHLITDYIRYATDRRLLFNANLEHGEVPVKMTIAGEVAPSVESLGNLPIKIDEQLLNLRHVLSLQQTQRWSEYYTRNNEDLFLTEIWLSKDAGLNKKVYAEALLAKIDPNWATNYSVLDASNEISANIQSLLQALCIALALVVVVLLVVNSSLKLTFVVLSAVPLGVMGAIFSLWVFDSTFSVNSMLGIILLSGITINNTILIADSFTRQHSGSMQDRIVKACADRIKAATVTSVTTILGMLPIAMGFGSNGAILQPLGVSVAGGLGLSLLLSLLLTPVLLQWSSRNAVPKHAADPSLTLANTYVVEDAK
jgi:HAE1 family hydrophobic/amphiphilic exporter-1